MKLHHATALFDAMDAAGQTRIRKACDDAFYAPDGSVYDTFMQSVSREAARIECELLAEKSMRRRT